MKKTALGIAKEIPSFKLNSKYLFVHKEDLIDSNFGQDNTQDLIEGGFALYSSAKVREKIGPLKSQFYRIGFCRKGTLQVDFGLETFTHEEDTIHFNFPGQLFALNNKSEDMYSYYILFTQEFIEDILPLIKIQYQYPFFDYAGIPFFRLSKDEASEIEKLFFAIDTEIKRNHPDKGTAIKLLLNLILIAAKRSYVRQGLTTIYHNPKATSLVVRYKKMVAQHFIKTRTVAEYAAKLFVTPKHLSKIVKEETGKNASDFIDEMLMMEISALLKYTLLSISEIAYQLDFTDPSHLTKFFKKHKNITPQKFRNLPL